MKAQTLLVVISAILISLIACQTNKDLGNSEMNENEEETTETMRCLTEGIVVNYEGLNQCGLLIELQDGKLLFPEKLPPGQWDLNNGMVVNLDYTIIEESTNACMAEDAVVELTCLKIIDRISLCAERASRDDLIWINSKIGALRPLSIREYKQNELLYYYFHSSQMNYLYDCEGNFICKVGEREKNECSTRIQTMEQVRIFYRRE